MQVGAGATFSEIDSDVSKVKKGHTEAFNR